LGGRKFLLVSRSSYDTCFSFLSSFQWQRLLKVHPPTIVEEKAEAAGHLLYVSVLFFDVGAELR
jgi:hypothetical protein